jgi:hypothetical protein
MVSLGAAAAAAAALYLLRRTRQKVPFTGRPHFVFVPAGIERALGANALGGEAASDSLHSLPFYLLFDGCGDC